jgi:hypothetical protein
MAEKRFIDPAFIRTPPGGTGDSTVFIKLLPFRIPKKQRNKLPPKDARWLDDDVLTPMESAVYNETLY